MKKILPVILFLLAATASARTYDATYIATLSNIPAGLEQLTVWIPLPASRGAQNVTNLTIDSPHAFTRRTDAHGNEYAFATIVKPAAGELRVRVKFTVDRDELRFDAPPETKATAAELKHALEADRLVTLSPRVQKLASEVTAGKSGTVEQARAIYDHLLATMAYDKTAPGWGQGDTERACDVRKGNCTDFHSLFMSLARAKGIPARFVIGFPLTASDGVVKGYHCWAEFWLDGKGWIPVDASDAAKSDDPKIRQYLFGNLDAARVQFTIGRDLELTPKTLDPLNYFIYPRAESNGKIVGMPSIEMEFAAR